MKHGLKAAATYSLVAVCLVVALAGCGGAPAAGLPSAGGQAGQLAGRAAQAGEAASAVAGQLQGAAQVAEAAQAGQQLAQEVQNVAQNADNQQAVQLAEDVAQQVINEVASDVAGQPGAEEVLHAAEVIVKEGASEEPTQAIAGAVVAVAEDVIAEETTALGAADAVVAVAGEGTVGSGALADRVRARATVAVSAVSAEQASQQLGDAIPRLKGHAVRVSNAGGYAGSATVAVPGEMQALLSQAVAMGGVGYYGLYDRINGAVLLTGGADGASGELLGVVETGKVAPADAATAQSQLQALFPGVQVVLSPLTGDLAGYPVEGHAFYGVVNGVGDDDQSGIAYVVGYTTVEGVSVAYALYGSGSYQQMLMP